MRDTPIVLFVDADPAGSASFTSLLGMMWDLRMASSGAEGLHLAKTLLPDFIVSDLHLPDTDGFELTTELRAIPQTASIPVLVLSARDDLNARLKAYDCGAFDFLSRQTEPEILAARLQALWLHQQALRARDDSRKEADSMARTLMTCLGETGSVLGCLRRLNTCQDHAGLARLCLESIREWGLEGIVRINRPKGALTYGPDGEATALEISIMDKAVLSGQVFQMRSQVVFNFPAFSLLVKQMPVADEDRCGRLRDYISMIAEAAHVRTEALSNQQLILKRSEQLFRAAKTTEIAMEGLEAVYQRQHREIVGVLSALQGKIESNFVFLGLSPDQEQRLMQSLNEAMAEMNHVFDSGLDLNAYLGVVLNELRSVGA